MFPEILVQRESKPDKLVVAKESIVGEDTNELRDIKNALTRRN